MRLAVQVIGVPVMAATAAAAGSFVVSMLASAAFGVCDPKFGCTFGLQFMAGLSAGVGFLVGLLLLCLFAGYTAMTSKLVSQRSSLVMAGLTGLALGSVWSGLATHSYA